MPHFPRELTLNEIVLNIEEPSAIGSIAEPDDKQWALVGQDRAVKALEMGMTIKAKGYNIYVAGESGTGKHTAIMDILSRHRSKNGSLSRRKRSV